MSGTLDASSENGASSLSTRGSMSDQTLEYDPRLSTSVAREPILWPRGRPRYVRLDSGGQAGGSPDSSSASEFRRPGQFERGVLRSLNIILALGSLIILLPIVLTVALLIRLDSPGPAFYRQQRVGLDRRNPVSGGPDGGRRVSDIGGLPFDILKFRSMRIDAEQISGPIWAQENDPRITRVGRLLRRTRLDELPQFWNVLRGDMSVVGPRPERPALIASFRDQIPGYMLRHKTKAGITGWAQVHGWRGDTSLTKRIEFDLYYIQHWSLWMDIKIVFLTVWRGFTDENAH